MFSIFKKKPALVTDISWLGVDVHSHILPGIDDGAKTVDESVSYITALNKLGFSKLICTPHIFTEIYPNSSATILPALQKVQDALQLANVDLQIRAGAEYMIDDSFKIEKDLMCLMDKYLLIEMSYLNETPNIEQVIFDLQIKGYQIVLAHPERYNFYHQNHERYRRFKDMGCLFQLNLLSVSGYYGKPVKLAADYLLKKGMYDLAGSDLHHDNHLRTLQNLVTSGNLYKLIGQYNFKNKEHFA
jgi:protein-tyrosine phosphatase